MTLRLPVSGACALLMCSCAIHVPPWVPRASVDLRGVPSARGQPDYKSGKEPKEEDSDGLVRNLLEENDVTLWLKWKRDF